MAFGSNFIVYVILELQMKRLVLLCDAHLPKYIIKKPFQIVYHVVCVCANQLSNVANYKSAFIDSLEVCLYCYTK